MFKVTINNQILTFDNPVRLTDLIDDPHQEYPVAKVNNRLRELHYQFAYDATVEFLKLDDPEAVLVYEASLRYLIAKAFNNLYPKYVFKFKYSISRATFCYIMTEPHEPITDVLPKLEAEMARIVDADYRLERLKVSKEEAIKFYASKGDVDRINILGYRPEKTVHFYRCNNYQNYLYSYMVPSTGYIKHYNLMPYDVGFLIQYPRAETNTHIPPFKDAPKYIDTLRQASIWADVVKADNIYDLNQHVHDNHVVDFVHMCEAKHNAMLTEIGDLIKNSEHPISLIAIAGPSSSGKTTFSNRLRIELMTRGIRPITISLDDYYLNREDLIEDEDGNVDLEHINTLDIDLFNQNMEDLIAGKETHIPRFDFKTKHRAGYVPMTITKDTPIIIEGIHALNNQLTKNIPKHSMFKIFISPQLQLNLDNHNPISITNVRLIRRIVRDHKFRNASALRTLSMWDSVRQGEFRWIYPNQEHADYVYNSGLQYELNVLKKYALPTLRDIPNDSPYYITANRLIKFMKYFVDIEDHHVPNNSLLREFIGGSVFTHH
jgi:uridine kinase